jgi:hypothetical protein
VVAEIVDIPAEFRQPQPVVQKLRKSENLDDKISEAKKRRAIRARLSGLDLRSL